MRDDLAGRDPVDDINWRLDAGPHEKEKRVISATVSFDVISRVVKWIFRRFRK